MSPPRALGWIADEVRGVRADARTGATAVQVAWPLFVPAIPGRCENDRRAG